MTPLHHILQTPDGPIAKISHIMHTSSRRVIHIFDNSFPSKIDRKAFDS
ncbi:HNH/ENDO VII family nuclease [Austwickia sp. TVS 96-490-7B]